jgi:hypothetical protein
LLTFYSVAVLLRSFLKETSPHSRANYFFSKRETLRAWVMATAAIVTFLLYEGFLAPLLITGLKIPRLVRQLASTSPT